MAGGNSSNNTGSTTKSTSRLITKSTTRLLTQSTSRLITQSTSRLITKTIASQSIMSTSLSTSKVAQTSIAINPTARSSSTTCCPEEYWYGLYAIGVVVGVLLIVILLLTVVILRSRRRIRDLEKQLKAELLTPSEGSRPKEAKEPSERTPESPSPVLVSTSARPSTPTPSPPPPALETSASSTKSTKEVAKKKEVISHQPDHYFKLQTEKKSMYQRLKPLAGKLKTSSLSDKR